MSALPNNCRYLAGTACDRADCDRSAACPGPVDMSPTADQRGRDRREEEKPMAKTEKAPVGSTVAETLAVIGAVGAGRVSVARG